MYDVGDLVQKDLKEAGKWYRLAAEGGHSMSQYNLGVMYAYGDGVRKDYELSYFWLLLAHSSGTAQALDAIKLLEKRLTFSQQRALKQKAESWKSTGM